MLFQAFHVLAVLFTQSDVPSPSRQHRGCAKQLLGSLWVSPDFRGSRSWLSMKQQFPIVPALPHLSWIQKTALENFQLLLRQVWLQSCFLHTLYHHMAALTTLSACLIPREQPPAMPPFPLSLQMPLTAADSFSVSQKINGLEQSSCPPQSICWPTSHPGEHHPKVLPSALLACVLTSLLN